jgi:hypothetical protein
VSHACEAQVLLLAVLLPAALQPVQVFDRMVATGKLELPTELLITLSTLENVVTSPYLTAEPSPRGGLTSPRGGGYMASPPSLPCSPALPQGQGACGSIAGSVSQRASSPGRSTSPNRVSCITLAGNTGNTVETVVLAGHPL